jgi:O-acetylserine/cysteine efflux transporter
VKPVGDGSSAVPSSPVPATQGGASGIAWAMAAVFFWSQAATCLKLSFGTVHWMTLAFWATLLPGLAYFVVAATTKRLQLLKTMPWRQILGLAGSGIAGYYLYNSLVFAAYSRGPASEVLIVNYLWPVATVAFASIFSRERPRPLELLGLSMALLGVMLVATRGRLQLPQAVGADLLAFCAALFYGIYSAGTKKLGGDRVIGLLITYTCCTTLFALTIWLTGGTFVIHGARAMFLTWYYGIAISATAGLFWLKALAAQSTARAAILVYLTPALGLVWLKLFVPGEEVTPWVLLGFGLIVGGFLVQLAKRKMPAGPGPVTGPAPAPAPIPVPGAQEVPLERSERV